MNISSKSIERTYYIAVNPQGEIMCWAGIYSYVITIKRNMLHKAVPDETEKILNCQYDKNKGLNRLWDEQFGAKGISIRPVKLTETPEVAK